MHRYRLLLRCTAVLSNDNSCWQLFAAPLRRELPSLQARLGTVRPSSPGWCALESVSLPESAVKTLCCGQVEEAAEEKLELSRELASMRARLNTVTQQAQQREVKAQAAERSACVAERAEQQAASLEDAQQEISALKERLAQAEASTAWFTFMYACTLLSASCASLAPHGLRIA